MPLPERTLPPVRASGSGDDLLRRAVDVLVDPGLAPVVALVCWPDGDVVRVANAAGRCAVTAAGEVRDVEGANPLARTDPYDDATDCFPFPGPRLHSAFADPSSPDLHVVHTGRHCWTDRGGHVGEHGSLNAPQSRAAFLLSGKGIDARGVVDGVARTVDVAATLVHLAGGDLEGMEGAPVPLAVAGAQHVVGLLWDGAASAELLEMESAGQLPAVSRLLARGCALRGGAIAEFPSVTLVNHTSALTGVGPGRHGILGNAFYDRAGRAQVVPNSSDEWPTATRWLREGVRTVWERLPAGVASACVNEPIDRGAGYSTFALVRAGATGGEPLESALPPVADDPHATKEHLHRSDYAWGTGVDALGLQQVLGLWREEVPPAVMWWNSTLTDAGHHAGGPGSEVGRAALRDTDRRLGAWLDLVEERGLLDDVVVLLTADHGFETSDPSCTGDWDEALAAAGIPFRDEGFGALYLGTHVL